MSTIGWPMLLLVLIIGLRLGGVSLGLLSGLALGLLTLWMKPAAPPNDLMLLQGTWLLLMATLEATGFFDLLETKLIASIKQRTSHYGSLVLLLCYAFVFLTGDTKWLHRWLQNLSHTGKFWLLVALRIAAHMALLASPLSISGILLMVVAGNGGLPILDLVAMIVAITLGITVTSSLLLRHIPDQWLIRLCAWRNDAVKDGAQVMTPSVGKVQLTFSLLLLAEALFLLIKPEASKLTELSYAGKIFPVRFPIFFALVMLSIAAVAMLGFKIKPVKILQTHRFELGIQQFFVFLGLTWLVDSLITYDKAYLIEMFSNGKLGYGFYLVVALSMLLIDMPIVIWLFTGLFIGQDYAILTLALWLVAVHSLAPLKYWITSMVQVYQKDHNI